MLAYLEQGNNLYVLAVCCLIGIIGKLTANHVYKSLIKQIESMPSATDKQLLQMKTKYESLMRMNGTVKETKAFVEKLMKQYKFAKRSLYSWEAFDLQLTGIGITICLLSAFGVYWMEGNLSVSVLYLSMSAITAIAIMVFHSITDSKSIQLCLKASLCHYFSNAITIRSRIAAEEKKEESSSKKSGLQDDIFMRRPTPFETEYTSTSAESKFTDRGRTKGTQKEELEALKESLSQIAAARSEGPDSYKRQLTPKEEQLIDEILKQYLS